MSEQECATWSTKKIIQTLTPLSRKFLIDNMEPERHVRLHKFNGLRCRGQAYQCTVTRKTRDVRKCMNTA